MRKEREKEETEQHLFAERMRVISSRVSREIEEGFSTRSKIDNRPSGDFLAEGETERLFLKFRSRAITREIPLVRFGTDILEPDIGIERDKWREISEYEPKNRRPVRGLISFPYFSDREEKFRYFSSNGRASRVTKRGGERERRMNETRPLSNRYSLDSNSIPV